MGIKVRGAARVERNIDRILNDIQGGKSFALQSAMILGALERHLHADRHLSTLNSQFREIVTDGA
jgi:hypothetical protein